MDGYDLLVTMLGDIQLWFPALEAMLLDAPPNVGLVEAAVTLAEHSFGWSYTDDGAARTGPRGADHFREAIYRIHQGITEHFGVVLRASRAGLREVYIVQVPQNVSYGIGGNIVGDLVREEGALPALFRRQPELNPGAVPAPGADPGALAALVSQKLPAAEPAALDEILAVEARLGVRLPEDVKALYLTAGSGELILHEDPVSAEFYGMDIIALGDDTRRQAYLPENRFAAWRYSATESLTADPAGRIQPLAGSALWFPVGADGGGNVYCADLAPARNGLFGQVIFLDHEWSTGAELVADSFTDLLVHQQLCAPAGPVRNGATVYLNRVAIADAAARADLEVVCLGKPDPAIDLTPLNGCRSVRTIDASSRRLADPGQVNSFHALEYLSMESADWRVLLDSQQMPGCLMAAHVNCGDTLEAVKIANEILASWGRPLITITALHRAPSARGRRAWWRRSKPS